MRPPGRAIDIPRPLSVLLHPPKYEYPPIYKNPVLSQILTRVALHLRGANLRVRNGQDCAKWKSEPHVYGHMYEVTILHYIHVLYPFCVPVR